MMQLIASMALLYAVVGSVGYWAVRRQREIVENTAPSTEPTP